MMTLTDLLKQTKQDLQQRSYHITQGIGWSSERKRHLCCELSKDGEKFFAKLAIANRADLDEPDMLEGLKREVWFSTIIGRLQEKDSSFPFTVPEVIESNLGEKSFKDKLAWVIFEYVYGKPIVNWEPELCNRRMDTEEEERFLHLLYPTINSLLALEAITPETLEELDLPQLPSPPHDMRRWKKRGFETTTLSNGAFEIKNFWRNNAGELVITDNEFAGWYPRYDSLAYLYHRLYTNMKAPLLAKRLLREYLDQKSRHNGSNDQFFSEFGEMLRYRILGGYYHDLVKRKFMPWHEKQRLRTSLGLSLSRGKYANLVA